MILFIIEMAHIIVDFTIIRFAFKYFYHKRIYLDWVYQSGPFNWNDLLVL